MERKPASDGCNAEPTSAERAASEWIVHLDSPEATSADRRRFEDWLAADPAHLAACDGVARTRRAFFMARSRRLHAARQTIRRRRSVTLAGALAAAAALATVAILAPRQPERSAPAPAQEYATRTGERSAISLPDGSVMELDAASVAHVDFTTGERRVVLENGTALFDVKRDPGAPPFVVRTPRGSIRVLGTSFVVQVSGSGVRTTVLRGVVRGEPIDRGILGLLDGEADAKPVTARANEEIVFGGAHVEVSSLPRQAVTRRLAWREGMLSFDDEPLRDAAAEVTRHTGVVFEFADASLGDTRIGGYIAASDVSDFLALLRTGLAIEAEQLTPTRMRLGRSQKPEARN
jgi:transmembrane sensor